MSENIAVVSNEPLTLLITLPDGCTSGRWEAAEAFSNSLAELHLSYPATAFQLLPFSYNTLSDGTDPALNAILAVCLHESTQIAPVAPDPLSEILSRSVAELEIDINIKDKNALVRGVRTIGDLVIMTEKEACRIKNFGPKSVIKTREALEKLGLSFGMILDANKKPLTPLSELQLPARQNKK